MKQLCGCTTLYRMGAPSTAAEPREQVVIVAHDPQRVAAWRAAVEALGLEALTAGDLDAAVAKLDGHVSALLFELGAGAQRLELLLDQLRQGSIVVPVIALEPASQSVDVARLLRGGVADVLSSTASEAELRLAIERVRALGSRLEWERPVARAGSAMYVGQYPSMLELEERMTRVAASDATVLIRGESGTGKELIARALHRASARRDGPFVKVLCPGLPENLLESELFGYERGAFTGAASRKAGRVELAQGGTLLLDEIAEMSASMQSKLLRLLQDREYERLGGGRVLRAEVRFVAATHRDLKSMIEAGDFREDLFHRLNVATLWVPPLRHRRNDVPALAQLFADGFAAQAGGAPRRVSPAALELMRRQSWPGNVRQLENFVERLVLFTEGPLIDVADVERELEEDERKFSTQQATVSSRRGAHGAPLAARDAADSGLESMGTLEQELWAVEHQLLVRALAKAKSKSEAASVLGVSRATLYNKLSRHGLLDSSSNKT